MFRNKNLKITFRTNNPLQNILNMQRPSNNINTYTQSGIYKMKCHTCEQSYIRQTGRKLEVRYKERTRYIKNNSEQSAYATHILHNLHSFGLIDRTMCLLHKATKGRRMNILENYYVQHFHFHNSITEEQTIT